jgi:hypothetical protein
MIRKGSGSWLGFQLAAEEVERSLGLSWGEAQKTLIDACDNGQLKIQRRIGEPADVWDIDFWPWLDAKLHPPPGGKQGKLLKLLAEMFPAEMFPAGVPPPKLCQRKTLIAKLLERDPELGPTLDEATVKKAVDAFNASLGIPIDPIRTVSD